MRDKEGQRHQDEPRKKEERLSAHCNIPNPLTVRVERSSGEGKRYAEEKEDRATQISMAQAQIRVGKVLNWITGAGTAVGLATLFFLYLSLRESRKALEVDQRAWISTFKVCGTVPGALSSSPEMCPDISSGSSPTGANAFYKNTGKTPALRFRVFTSWAPKEVQIPDSDADPAGLSDSYPILIVAPNAVENSAPHIPKGVVDGVNQGNSGGFVFGTIWYDDIFGKHHSIQFCAEIGPKFNFFPACSVHHDTDTN